MRKGWLLSVGICLLWVSLCIPQNALGQADDNLLLAKVLEKEFGGRSGFTVVAPKTSFVSDKAPFRDPIEQTRTRERLKVHFNKEGYNIGPLVDLLFERNTGPVRLSLKSCPQNGYFIDYHEKYYKYFEKNGGGWKKLGKENPKARGMTRISLPAYDPDLHILLVYYGTQYDWLAGAGYVVAYRYENDQLNELGRITIWIS
ncbi:MAG: hypothetical protein ACLQJ7_01155 [Syntrophobacteraceae bacterium]